MSADRPRSPTASAHAPARYRLVGTTTERDTCQCCGRTELKRVVVLHDGDDDVYVGSQCAARLLGKPVGALNREAATAQRQRERAERAARDAAQRQADRAAAVAAGFGDDLEGLNAFFTAGLRPVPQRPRHDRQLPRRPRRAPPRRVRPLPRGRPRAPAAPPQTGGRS